MGLRLQCTVCQGQYSTKQEWLGHLMEPQHQVPARQEIGSWQGKKWREQTLVVFSKQSVGADDRLVQYFSRDLGTYVTDFVWEPERPKVGFIQFDSRKTLRKILSPVKDQQVVVDGQLFQVKEADSYTDFEWEGLIPAMANCDQEMLECSESSESESESDSSNESVVHMDCRTNSERDTQSQSQTGNISTTAHPIPTEEASTGAVKVKVESQGQSWSNNNPNEAQLGCKLEPESQSGVCLLTLKEQLEAIKKITEISDDEYTSVLRLVSLLQQIFSKFGPNTAAERSRVILSGNWSLKLQHENNPPFIFIQRTIKNTPPQASGFNLRVTKSSDLFAHLQDPEKNLGLFLSVKGAHAPKDVKINNGLLVSFIPSDLTLTDLPLAKLTGQPNLNLEIQLWQLTKYLCTFDNRCEPLLAVVYYWANVNSIKLASAEPKAKNSLHNIPDPFGITWLVILFLCRGGHLPEPKLVLDRSSMENCIRLRGRNIGLFADPEFARIWITCNETRATKGSETFALEIFTLAAEFFLSCGQTLRTGNWVIDSQTGEWLRTKEFLKLRCQGGKMGSVRTMVTNNRYRLHLINPFGSEWRINLSSSVKPYEAMLRTGTRLKEALQTYNVTKGVGPDFLQLFKN